jgi:hypothetical protein
MSIGILTLDVACKQDLDDTVAIHPTSAEGTSNPCQSLLSLTGTTLLRVELVTLR